MKVVAGWLAGWVGGPFSVFQLVGSAPHKGSKWGKVLRLQRFMSQVDKG